MLLPLLVGPSSREALELNLLRLSQHPFRHRLRPRDAIVPPRVHRSGLNAAALQVLVVIHLQPLLQ